MKKFIILLFLIPLNVLANSRNVTPSTNNLTVQKGKSTFFNVTAYETAGRLDFTSSDTSVATLDKNAEWVDNGFVIVNVKGLKAGVSNITISMVNGATFSEGTVNETYNIRVTVTDPYASKPNKKDETTNFENKLSTNNKLKNFNVDGYKLTKKNEENYYLEVPNNVDNINIEGAAEDNKAKIKGLGKFDIKVGENTFNIDVTSESGKNKRYVLTVKKRDAIYLDELEELLKINDKNLIEVKLKDDDEINESIIKEIQKNKKKVIFNCSNNDNKILYRWILDGNKIKSNYKLNKNINITSKLTSDIEKVSNYAKGLLLEFFHNGKLPEGTKVKIYVGDLYENDEKLNLYFYDKEKGKLISKQNDINVVNKYIEIDIDHCSSYFLSKTSINEVKENIANKNIYNIIIISIATVISIIIGILLHSEYIENKKFSTNK